MSSNPKSIAGVPFDSVGILRTTLLLRTTCMRSWYNWRAICVVALLTIAKNKTETFPYLLERQNKQTRPGATTKKPSLEWGKYASIFSARNYAIINPSAFCHNKQLIQALWFAGDLFDLFPVYLPLAKSLALRCTGISRTSFSIKFPRNYSSWPMKKIVTSQHIFHQITTPSPSSHRMSLYIRYCSPGPLLKWDCNRCNKSSNLKVQCPKSTSCSKSPALTPLIACRFALGIVIPWCSYTVVDAIWPNS